VICVVFGSAMTDGYHGSRTIAIDRGARTC
jgi:hypothetical protein